MDKHPGSSDAAAIFIFGLGAIAIILAMYFREDYLDFIGEFIKYVYGRQSA